MAESPAVDETASLMHEIGAGFAAGLTQPGTMQAALTADGLLSQTYDAAGVGARIGRWGLPYGADVDALLRRLRSAVAADGSLLVELTGTPGAGYQVTYQAGADDDSALPELEPVVVLDPGYRLPGHPRPGMARPARTGNDGRPTDPAVLAEVQGLVAEFVAAYSRR